MRRPDVPSSGEKQREQCEQLELVTAQSPRWLVFFFKAFTDSNRHLGLRDTRNGLWNGLQMQGTNDHDR